MKTAANILSGSSRLAGLAGSVAACFALCSSSARPVVSDPVMTVTLTKATASTNSSATKHRKVLVEELDSGDDERKEVTWLGVSADELSESLAVQLGLRFGEGLLITYVPENGPAAKAGVQKNDVLVKLDDQLLLMPVQLRRLVQMHKVGDSVTLTLYRGGNKQTVPATLGKAPRGSNLLPDRKSWRGDLEGLQLHLKELPMGDALRLEMKELQESLAKSALDKESVKIEVQRSLAEARKAAAEALRNATNAQHSYGSAALVLEELARKGGQVEKDARVTVKSRSRDLRTVVTTDDDGSYVVVASPKKRLTAHGKDGKLVFDGEIETPEQQDKVPRDIWDKVKPMLEEIEPAQSVKNP